MSFNSLSFLIFFPVVTILYYITSHKWRWLVLLIASCMFYMAFIPWYIFILFYLIVVDYWAGLFISSKKGQKRRVALFISILSNVGVLFLFKYFNFFQENTAQLAHIIHWNYSPQLLDLILPIGLSFHTFQSLSYVIEVYKRKYKPERHFGIYALYVMFYPQLVAGPIERPQELLPQFRTRHVFNENNVTEGLRRMLFGFFKKLVIADRLAILVNQIYGHPHYYVGFPLILATVAFAIQIYCDFSGYSDIAIGAAKVMGFSLRENFNYPYLARSIPDFWRRWHMSLYAWFRDYIYIPLGGNRKGKILQIRNILIVFFITGLWHGANWTYIVWGGIHGIYLVGALLISQQITPLIKIKLSPLSLSIFHILQGIMTFALVCFAWIFFRAASLSDAFYIATHLTTGIGSLMKVLLHLQFTTFIQLAFLQGAGLGLKISQIEIALIAIIILEFMQFIQRRKGIVGFPLFIRWGIYVALTLMVLNLGPADQVPFIYFQF